MDLKNKIAIVTGSSKGIGLATTQALLAKGAKVAGWSRSSPEITNENFRFYPVDITDPQEVKKAYNITIEDFRGDVSILVNNAGIGYAALIEETSVERWKEMFETNVNGVFYCSQAVIPRMKKLGVGHIINIGSIAATQGVELMAGYSGTKFAVRGISQAMFKELRDFGIKVSVVNPGSVQTHFFGNIEHLKVNEHMMSPVDIAESIIYLLETSTNYHPVELEVRPLMPKGRKVN